MNGLVMTKLVYSTIPGCVEEEGPVYEGGGIVANCGTGIGGGRAIEANGGGAIGQNGGAGPTGAE